MTSSNLQTLEIDDSGLNSPALLSEESHYAGLNEEGNSGSSGWTLLPSRHRYYYSSSDDCNSLFQIVFDVHGYLRRRGWNRRVWLGLAGVGFLCWVVLQSNSSSSLQRNRLQHDYSDLDSIYQVKTAELDHWCLMGGNEDCMCEDPTEAFPRQVHGYDQAHTRNQQLADDFKNSKVDVVFVGDDIVEEWNGRRYGLDTDELNDVHQAYLQTFTKQGGSTYESVALGISGDTCASLLWRLQNGECPVHLDPMIWWIMVGSNDLAVAECSEEAVILGILRVAEEIAERKPDQIIVIQGILPRSFHDDGSLPTQDAKASYSLWSSTQLINQELEAFCAKHDHFVYFDASRLFISNDSIKSQLMMPDHYHLSTAGYHTLNTAIAQELHRIIYENNEDNDIAQSRQYPRPP